MKWKCTNWIQSIKERVKKVVVSKQQPRNMKLGMKRHECLNDLTSGQNIFNVTLHAMLLKYEFNNDFVKL